jgi:hypothetical protein
MSNKPSQTEMFDGSVRITYVCHACGEYCPDTGGWGPPLMSPASKWYCRKHARQEWRVWHAENKPTP